jgi:predicted  nucleic acid-binding Zn-ribbon protein
MANFIDNESYLKEKAKSLEDQLKDSINEIQRLNKDIERLRRLTTSFGDCYIFKH